MAAGDIWSGLPGRYLGFVRNQKSFQKCPVESCGHIFCGVHRYPDFVHNLSELWTPVESSGVLWTLLDTFLGRFGSTVAVLRGAAQPQVNVVVSRRVHEEGNFGTADVPLSEIRILLHMPRSGTLMAHTCTGWGGHGRDYWANYNPTTAHGGSPGQASTVAELCEVTPPK